MKQLEEMSNEELFACRDALRKMVVYWDDYLSETKEEISEIEQEITRRDEQK